MQKGHVHLIGSDAHNNKNRNFCLKKTYDLLEEMHSVHFVDGLKKNSANLLKGHQLHPMIDFIEEKSKNNSFIDKFKRIFK